MRPITKNGNNEQNYRCITVKMITTWKQDKLIEKWENITNVPKPIIQVDEIYFNEHLCNACYENHYVIHLSYFYTFHHDWFMSMPHHAM